jgi:hypothetical protein
MRAYIEGVVDGWTAALSETNATNKLCVRNGVTAGELMKIVVKYGAKQTYSLEWPAYMTVVAALQESFPCGK